MKFFRIQGEGEQSSLERIYWTERTKGGALFAQHGQLYSSTSDGVGELPSNRLTVRNVTPSSGQSVSASDIITLYLSGLIDTDADKLSENFTLTYKASGDPVNTDAYTLTGENTVRGAIVRIALSVDMVAGEFIVNVNDNLKDLSGRSLLQELAHELVFVNGVSARNYFRKTQNRKWSV